MIFSFEEKKILNEFVEPDKSSPALFNLTAVVKCSPLSFISLLCWICDK